MSPYNWVIYPFTQPQVANQQKKIINDNLKSPEHLDELFESFRPSLFQGVLLHDQSSLKSQDVDQLCKDLFSAADNAVDRGDCAVGRNQVNVKDHVQLSSHFVRAPDELKIFWKERNLLPMQQAQKFQTVLFANLENGPDQKTDLQI